MEWLTLDEMEQLARARLPEATSAFIDGGAGDGRVVTENTRAFGRIALRPRVMVDVSTRSTSANLLGSTLATPVAVAPSAMHGMVHSEAELATVAGASRAGALTVLSLASSLPVETVMARASAPVWFQTYVAKDRVLTAEVTARAEAAGCAALVVTVDAPVVGGRNRELRAGFSVDPSWFADGHTPMYGMTSPVASGRAATELWDPTLQWADVPWLRSLTDLPIVLKGVLRPDDAVRAADEGIDAVVVSNHGGRQLDGAIPAIDTLADVVAAIAGRIPVLVDGGIRRGVDVLVALALGAGAVLVGRPILWGLATGGADGVERVLRLLTDELELAMALCGAPTLQDLDASLIVDPRPITA